MAKAREAAPHVQLEGYTRALEKAASLPRLTVLRGPEKWFHQEALAAAVARAKALGLEVHHYDPSDPDYTPSGLYGDLGGASLFGDAIFVVVRGGEELCKKDGSKDSEFVAALEAYCQSADPPGAVLLMAPGLRADNKAVKLTASLPEELGGVALNFRTLYDSPPSWGNARPEDVELVQWCRARAKQLGLPLKPEEAVFVAGAMGNDLGAIDSELKRLVVTGTDELKRSIGWQSGGTPWDVAEKLLTAPPREAIGAVETLFAKGFQGKDKKRVLDASALVSMLLGSLHKSAHAGLAVCEARDRGQSKEVAMQLAGLTGPPKAKERALQAATARTAGEWRAFQAALLDIERKLKTGREADVNDFVLLAGRFGRKPARAGR